MVQILPMIKQHKCGVGAVLTRLPGGPLACPSDSELSQAPPGGLIGTLPLPSFFAFSPWRLIDHLLPACPGGICVLDSFLRMLQNVLKTLVPTIIQVKKNRVIIHSQVGPTLFSPRSQVKPSGKCSCSLTCPDALTPPLGSWRPPSPQASLYTLDVLYA